jgi:hypothetical protein
MHVALLLLCQAAALDGGPELPRIADLEWQEKKEPVEHLIGVEAFAFHTSFDTGLRIEDHAGVGVDVEFAFDFGTPRVFGFSLGAAGLNTENDDGLLPDDRVTVRQYRAGFWADFSFRFVEFGGAATVGVYRFAREGENDTSPFIELEGNVGVRPMEQFKAGLLFMATHTQSSFNRTHTHLFHNYSWGLFVEFRF